MPTVPDHFSAVVVSFYTGSVLTKCLAALLDAPLCQQIVLVNNGNPPEVMKGIHDLARREPKIMVLNGHGNIGFGCGCNLGAASANQTRLLFVNPDCVIDQTALPALADALTQYPDALIGGALRNENGSEQRGGRRGELTLWSALISFTGFARSGEQTGIWRDFNRTAEPLPRAITDMPVVSGALMAIQKAAFEAVGGFDPAFFLHVEDVDLCRRIRESGGRVMFAPHATGLHIGATSDTSSWAVERAKIASFGHYFWKNAHTPLDYLGVMLLLPLVAGAILIRKLARF
jgi:N-acetylglucosaminyl-diphospho-decaprenol L-rhamnosyltransferase